METFGRYLNVIDVEATCWEGPPPPGQVREIIEIGLCIVDVVLLKRVERHQIVIRPQRSEVSDFCTRLTGWTARDLASGLTFRNACAHLIDQHHADSRAWTSWGDYDRKQFGRQCDAEQIAYPFSARHTNAKVAFSQAHGLAKRLGMHQALDHAGLPLQGRHHCGADDAWNIGALVVELVRRGEWPVEST